MSDKEECCGECGGEDQKCEEEPCCDCECSRKRKKPTVQMAARVLYAKMYEQEGKNINGVAVTGREPDQSLIVYLKEESDKIPETFLDFAVAAKVIGDVIPAS